MVTSGAIETLRAVPLLSHAYHEIQRAYPDSLRLNLKNGTIDYGSHSGYEDAVNKTISDIKIAYTKGWLNAPDIKNLIQLHLPEELQQDTSDADTRNEYEIVVGIPSHFDDKKLSFLKHLTQTLEKKHKSTCFIDEQNIVIRSEEHSVLGGSYEAIDYAIDFLKSGKALPKGQKALEKKVHQISRSFHPLKVNKTDEQIMTIHSTRNDAHTTQRRHNQIHVFDHLRHFVTSIDKGTSETDLQPLAAFLHHQKEHTTNTLVCRLNETEIHLGKGADDEVGFYVYTPRYTNDQVGDFARRDRQLKMAYGFLEKLADYQGQESSFELSDEIIKDAQDQVIRESRDLSNPYMTTAEVTNLSLNELELAVLDLDPPINFEDLLPAIGIDHTVREHAQMIFDKMEILTERGIFKERRGKYSVPSAYTSDETLLRVIEEKDNGYVIATPLEWDEKLHGVTPRLFVSPKYHKFDKLELNDTLIAALDYEQGRISHLEIKERMSIEQFVPFLSPDERPDPTTLFERATKPTEDAKTEQEAPRKKKYTGNVRRTQGTRPDNKHNPQAAKAEKLAKQAQEAAAEARQTIPEDTWKPDEEKAKKDNSAFVMAGILVKDENGNLLFESAETSNLRQQFKIASSAVDDQLQKGDITYAQMSGKNKVRVTDVHGNMSQKENFSILQAAKHKIPMKFSEAALAELEGLEVPKPDKYRKDLRHIEACTMDGRDARDFDDAVYAEELPNGDHLIYVFVADVDHYVRPNSVLDKEARERGNSTYFPNMVIPMLPEKLSEGLCSLNPNVDRACLAWSVILTADGQYKNPEFNIALMRSRHRLTYEEAERALAGEETSIPQEYVEQRLKPLQNVKAILRESREKRGALDLQMDEQKVFVDDEDNITGTGNAARLETCKIIEEFMLAENESSFAFVKNAGKKPVARIHDTPDPERIGQLREFLSTQDINLPEINVASDFNGIINEIEERENAADLKTSILTSLARAAYSMDNIGHFGLNYDGYSHTTSPIRRFPDLEQHRLIKSIITGKGPDYLGNEDYMEQGCQQWSMTERRSDEATAAASKSYAINYLIENAGKSFEAEIAHVTSYGYYVNINKSGAQGLIHIANMDDDYYVFDSEARTLTGQNHGKVFSKGDTLKVMLEAADALEGNVEFSRVPDDREKPYQPKQRKQQLG